MGAVPAASVQGPTVVSVGEASPHSTLYWLIVPVLEVLLLTSSSRSKPDVPNTRPTVGRTTGPDGALASAFFVNSAWHLKAGSSSMRSPHVSLSSVATQATCGVMRS